MSKIVLTKTKSCLILILCWMAHPAFGSNTPEEYLDMTSISSLLRNQELDKENSFPYWNYDLRVVGIYENSAVFVSAEENDDFERASGADRLLSIQITTIDTISGKRDIPYQHDYGIEDSELDIPTKAAAIWRSDRSRILSFITNQKEFQNIPPTSVAINAPKHIRLLKKQKNMSQKGDFWSTIKYLDEIYGESPGGRYFIARYQTEADDRDDSLFNILGFLNHSTFEMPVLIALAELSSPSAVTHELILALDWQKHAGTRQNEKISKCNAGIVWACESIFSLGTKCRVTGTKKDRKEPWLNVRQKRNFKSKAIAKIKDDVEVVQLDRKRGLSQILVVRDETGQNNGVEGFVASRFLKCNE